jgi:hypothetical protein
MNKTDFVMPVFFGLAGMIIIVIVLVFPSKDTDVNRSILAMGASSFSGAIALSAPNLSKRE